MAITKQSIIEWAYQDIGFDGNLESTRLSQGLRTLDRMMAAWLQGGLDIGYLVAESSALTDDSGLLLQHIGAVQMNLAVNLARALAIPADLGYAGMARQAYRDLLQYNPPELARNPLMPLGAGNTPYYVDNNPYQQIDVAHGVDASDQYGIDIVDDAGFIITE